MDDSEMFSFMGERFCEHCESNVVRTCTRCKEMNFIEHFNAAGVCETCKKGRVYRVAIQLHSAYVIEVTRYDLVGDDVIKAMAKNAILGDEQIIKEIEIIDRKE